MTTNMLVSTKVLIYTCMHVSPKVCPSDFSKRRLSLQVSDQRMQWYRLEVLEDVNHDTLWKAEGRGSLSRPHVQDAASIMYWTKCNATKRITIVNCCSSRVRTMFKVLETSRDIRKAASQDSLSRLHVQDVVSILYWTKYNTKMGNRR